MPWHVSFIIANCFLNTTGLLSVWETKTPPVLIRLGAGLTAMCLSRLINHEEMSQASCVDSSSGFTGADGFWRAFFYPASLIYIMCQGELTTYSDIR